MHCGLFYVNCADAACTAVVIVLAACLQTNCCCRYNKVVGLKQQQQQLLLLPLRLQHPPHHHLQVLAAVCGRCTTRQKGGPTTTTAARGSRSGRCHLACEEKMVVGCVIGCVVLFWRGIVGGQARRGTLLLYGVGFGGARAAAASCVHYFILTIGIIIIQVAV